MISITTSGSTKRTERFLKAMMTKDIFASLDGIAREGVAALQAATPKDSGETANSWTYEIEKTRGSCTISWSNANVNNGVNIAVILQYGHGTGTGGYVSGRDYINPALRPVFDKLAEKAWKEVTSA